MDDEYAADVPAKAPDMSLPEPDDGDDAVHSEPGAGSPTRIKRRGFRGLLSKANMQAQDQLLER